MYCDIHNAKINEKTGVCSMDGKVLPSITAVLENPCTHGYLKDALNVFLTKDPIDAVNDAELLAELMRQRVENFL